MNHRIKLQQPDRDRARVRDLAAELGVPYQDVLAFVRSTGEYVQSRHSQLEVPTIRAVREHFGSDTAMASETAPTLGEAETGAPPANSDGLTAPKRRSRRENNPFTGVLRNFTPKAEVDMKTSWTSARPTRHESRTTVDEPGDYSAAGAVEPSESMKHLEWKVRGIDDLQRDVWLAHGLSGRHARIAAECRDAGLTPADLGKDVAGFTVLHRVTHGEPPLEVCRLLVRDSDTG